MAVVMVVALASIPLGILLSALWDRSLRRRSHFWRRFTALVICMMLPWLVGLSGEAGESGFFYLLWIGFFWALLLVVLTPLFLFRGPGFGPGPSDDDGPGPGPGDDREPPNRPIGGIPLPDAEQPARRTRGPHRRRVADRRRPARERERRPVRLWSPRHP